MIKTGAAASWPVLCCVLGLARVASAATVDNFVPTSGTVGTVVTIVGSGFTGVTSVSFGSQLASGFSFVDDNTLTATVSAAAGRGPITVSAPSGVGQSLTDFSPIPSISAFTPDGGIAGAVVTLTCANFSQLAAGGITFNGTAATVFGSVGGSYTQYTAVVPAGATIGKISVTTPGGTGTTANDFIAGPQVTGFTPGSGPVGASVTVDGLNFQGAVAVTFNAVPGSITGTTGTQLTVVVPAGASTGPLAVTTPIGGTGASTASFVVITVDAGSPDAGTPPDAGAPFDAGSPDSGTPLDAGAPFDAGSPDSGTPDAGAPFDAGVPADAGLTDAGSRFDGGSPDAGIDPAGSDGCGCSSTSVPGAAALLALLLLRRQRKSRRSA